jgi:hypothetical protein
MAKCNLQFPFIDSVSDLVTNLKDRIEQANGDFNGNTSGGSFSVPTPLGRIEGTYKINGQLLLIAISKRPIIISCNKIAQFIENEIPD